MAFGQFGTFDTPMQPIAEINTTPLVDVMLVLLVIFMLAAPLMTHAIRLDLPRGAAPSMVTEQPPISISIDATGQFFWDGVPLVDVNELRTRLTTAGREASDTEIQLHADQQVRYNLIAELLAEAQQAGIRKIGFVMAPRNAAR